MVEKHDRDGGDTLAGRLSAVPRIGSGTRICGLIVLSLVEFRVFFQLHRENLYELAVAAHDVIAGTPHWRAFQSRLLGPYLVAGWSALTGVAYETAHALVLVALTIAANLTAFAVFRRLTGSADIAFRYTIYFLCGFLVLVADEWVFVWDFLDMPIFVLFAFGVFTQQSWRYWLPLFLVAIVNRESALFIAAWVIIDAAARKRWSDAAVGTAMFAAGVAYTILVRQALFLHSSLDDASSFIEIPVVGNQFNLIESARRAAVHLLNPAIDMVFLIHVAYLAFAVYVAYHWQTIRERYLAQFVLIVAMLAAVPTFGFFDEARQYAYLVPMLLAFDLALRDKMAPCLDRRSSRSA
jgi:hypothetical protein